MASEDSRGTAAAGYSVFHRSRRESVVAKKQEEGVGREKRERREGQQ